MKSSRLILLFFLPFLSGFFSAVSFAQSISFIAATNFAAGNGPSSVAAGDFNGDGQLDLAVANSNSNNVSILLGNGNGIFGAATNFGVAGNVLPSVVVGDFNGDGRLDLAVANSNSNNVSILLGNGNGTFGAATNFGVAGNVPRSVVVGDFNADGRQDLAVANLISNNVSILLGNGNGTFGAATNFAAGNGPLSVVVGDFNGDGRQDLAVVNTFSNNVSILLGNGNGTFGVATNFATGNGPLSVAVGDFNGDGRQDLAVANSNSNNVSILLNGTGFATGGPLVAAILPSSRSVQVNTPASAFATVINTGQAIAAGCSIAPLTSVPASFVYQTTDPATNQVTGFPNVPANIAAGAAQTFVFAFTPTFPIASTDVQLSFDCTNTNRAPINSGLNTLLLSSSLGATPDIVALPAASGGIVDIPGPNGTGAFAVATVNLGASGSITASADTGSATLPVVINLCQTNPSNGQCISAIGPSVTTQINANATPAFGIFVEGNGNVPFDPAANRIFVRFKDSANVTRGSTSVAVRTQ